MQEAERMTGTNMANEQDVLIEGLPGGYHDDPKELQDKSRSPRSRRSAPWGWRLTVG